MAAGGPAPGQSARAIASLVLSHVRPGSIILGHANGRGWHAAKALPLFVPMLKSRGFEFVTVSELLAALTPRDARKLGKIFAAIDPWKRVNWPAERLENYLAGSAPGAPRFAIECDGGMAGAAGIEAPWLHGYYLRFLGIVPDFQNAGIGAAVMTWLEGEARGRTRNLWVCVSAFNDRAAGFYERQGYARAAIFEDLVKQGEDEILLRKRI